MPVECSSRAINPESELPMAGVMSTFAAPASNRAFILGLSLSVRRVGDHVLPENFRENVRMRISVSEVLSKCLGMRDVSVRHLRCLAAPDCGPLTHRNDVFVDPMLCSQPFSLARMAGKHLRLEIDVAPDIQTGRAHV